MLNLPATKRLLMKELVQIITKMQVVVPRIPDGAYKQEQQKWLINT